jgi:hypothetical protein
VTNSAVTCAGAAARAARRASRAQRRVEVGERLVEQQHARLDDERAGERHALLLAARQRLHGARPRAVEPHAGERAPRALAPLGLRTPRASSPKATLSSTDRCGKSA